MFVSRWYNYHGHVTYHAYFPPATAAEPVIVTLMDHKPQETCFLPYLSPFNQKLERFSKLPASCHHYFRIIVPIGIMNWLQGCHVLQSVLYCKKLHRRKILPHNTFLLLHLILSRSDLGTKWVITRVVTSGISDKWRRQYPVTLSWVPGRWHQSCWQYCDNIITENWTLNKKIMSHVLSFFRVLSSFRKRSYTTIEKYFILLSQKNDTGHDD